VDSHLRHTLTFSLLRRSACNLWCSFPVAFRA